MILESKPSIGADCHWSSPLPCGIPSITSTITTMLASSFSAMRCAVVAPTLPAPTTVILLTIVGLYDFVRVCVESYPGHTRGAIARDVCSPANLRQRSQSTHTHLQQVVLARFGRQRAPEEWFERNSLAQRTAQIDFVFPEKACAQTTIGREPDPVAAPAIGM